MIKTVIAMVAMFGQDKNMEIPPSERRGKGPCQSSENYLKRVERGEKESYAEC